MQTVRTKISVFTLQFRIGIRKCKTRLLRDKCQRGRFRWTIWKNGNMKYVRCQTLLYTKLGGTSRAMHLDELYAEMLLVCRTSGRFLINGKDRPPSMGHHDFVHRFVKNPVISLSSTSRAVHYCGRPLNSPLCLQLRRGQGQVV